MHADRDAAASAGRSPRRHKLYFHYKLNGLFVAITYYFGVFILRFSLQITSPSLHTNIIKSKDCMLHLHAETSESIRLKGMAIGYALDYQKDYFLC